MSDINTNNQTSPTETHEITNDLCDDLATIHGLIKAAAFLANEMDPSNVKDFSTLICTIDALSTLSYLSLSKASDIEVNLFHACRAAKEEERAENPALDDNWISLKEAAQSAFLEMVKDVK